MESFKNIFKLKRVMISFMMLGLLSACSDTEFSKKEMQKMSYNVNVGQVDILFVVDNSGSMSAEQRRMADSFPNFVQDLDLAGLDYRIGIVTTDVQSRENPLVSDGLLQNGNLIEFSDGSFFLTPESKDIENKFWATIQRPETATCEQSGYQSSLCPSDDERGIYSAYLAVNANKKDFFRENGHASFIFLTDEDVRGEALNNHPYRWPEPLDYPENLVQIVKTKLGSNTDLSAHAIVTDSVACRNQQMAQGGNSNIHGVIGSFYMAMANPSSTSLINAASGVTIGSYAGGQMVQGVVGSICASNYVSELGSIKSVLSKLKTKEKLKCKLFEAESVDIRIDSDYEWTVSEDLTEIHFSPGLPPGKSFKISYECP